MYFVFSRTHYDCLSIMNKKTSIIIIFHIHNKQTNIQDVRVQLYDYVTKRVHSYVYDIGKRNYYFKIVVQINN